ncbi:MAG: hypothetical protein K2O32_05150 [Acetatifactor sp.]|nr:hypothetical protein [Acetatifactor sp.]
MTDDRRYARLNKAFFYVEDALLDLVEQQKRVQKRKKLKRALLSTVAACICLFLVLPVAAMTYNWFGLRDLLMPREIIEPTQISLAEYQEYPEIQALKEWKEFLAGYDVDKEIQAKAENSELPAIDRDDWLLYGVYSLEMGEKLDEITDKYHLSLHTEQKSIDLATLETMTNGKIMSGVSAETALVYEDGAFRFNGSTELAGYEAVEFQFGYTVKGVFAQDMPAYGDMADYTQLQYLSASGESVLLVTDSKEDMIIADLGGCLVTIVVPAIDGENITAAALQELADKIDFNVLKAVYARQNQKLYLADYDIVTLSGYQSSPEAQALAEWTAFLTEYDIESATENEVFIAEGRDDWSLYPVYNYEMGQKLDEIADKYQLKLYSEMNVISPEEMEYRVGGDFMKDCIKYWGYIYGDGSFHFSGDAELAGCGITSFQFGRSVKGTFGDVILNIGQVEEYKQWQYLSACGEPVLLALGPSKALIFADLEECFISVNILSGSEEGMTTEDLQELADKIDFGILGDVKIPDMRGDSEVPQDTESEIPNDQVSQSVPEMGVLQLGNMGNLGLGFMVCIFPDQVDEDYQLYFWGTESDSEDMHKSFSEIEFDLGAVDYIFPDVREGNASIGRFLDIYFWDTTEVPGADKQDFIIIARYDVEGKINYDTRAYTVSGNGYCVDEELTRELNEKYSDAEEYPVTELFVMPHD